MNSFCGLFIAMAVRIVFPDCGEHNNYGETACIFLDDNTSEDVFSVTRVFRYIHGQPSN